MKFHGILFGILMLISTTLNADGKQYDIGNKRKIYMECKGEGDPVVLLIAGYKERGDYAFDTVVTPETSESVYAGVSKFTTVCWYDRPGTIIIRNDNFEMSRSTPAPQPVTVNDQVNDLAALINSAHIKKPFILVAHSAGGMIARMYAHKYPHNIAGLLLLDVTTEDLKDKWNRKEWTIFDYSNNVLLDERLYQREDLEWIDMDVSFFQMQQTLRKGKNRIKLQIPHVVIMTATRKAKAEEMTQSGMWPNWVSQETADDIIKKVWISQDELGKSFIPAARHEKINTGHKIQAEQPALVVDAIRVMVTDIRNKKNH